MAGIMVLPPSGEVTLGPPPTLAISVSSWIKQIIISDGNGFNVGIGVNGPCRAVFKNIDV